MRRAAIALILLACAAEAIAWWWMHPPLAGAGMPVLTWNPENKEHDTSSAEHHSTRNQMPAGQGLIQLGTSGPSLQPSSLNPHPSLIPRPDIYAKSAPMLRCSDGRIFQSDRPDGSTIFLAFFEWNASDTGSVLEAFRHMPEACMGSIGLQLVEKAKPITYPVGTSRQDQDARGADHRSSKNEEQGSSSNSLVFDHTVFRVPAAGPGPRQIPGATSTPATGEILHAFKAVWVSGMENTYGRDGLMGNDQNQLRSIRLKSAFHRYRPAHARVVQGAVRGITDPDLAWQAFETAMLRDLQFR